MAPSDRFKPIQKLNVDRERKAASLLGETLKTRDAARQRLRELQDYLGEYRGRFESAGRDGMGGARLHEYMAFIGKLEQAIAEQRAVLESKQADCDASREAWRGRYTRSRAVDAAVRNMKSQETKAADKREQALADDRSQRRK